MCSIQVNERMKEGEAIRQLDSGGAGVLQRDEGDRKRRAFRGGAAVGCQSRYLCHWQWSAEPEVLRGVDGLGSLPFAAALLSRPQNAPAVPNADSQS